MLPIPDESPPEIPRIIMQNEQKGKAFHFSLSRLDVIRSYANNPPASDIREQLELARVETAGLWGLLQKELSARGHRMALVSTFFADTDNAAEVLSSYFIRAKEAAGAAEAQVHYLHKLGVGQLRVNRWVRFTTSESKPRLLNLMIDVNTVPELDIDVGADTVLEFLGSSLDLVVASLSSEREGVS
jgi:hypothetical protein